MGAPHEGCFTLDLNDLPVEQRFPAWAAGMPAYQVSTFDPPAFTARVSAWRTPPLRITETYLGAPVRFLRTPAHIEADGVDDITVQLFVAGRGAGVADGRPFTFMTGDIAVQDSARPIEAASSANRTVTLGVPRGFLDAAAPPADIHGLILRGPQATLLRAFLRGLPEALRGDDGLAPADTARLARDLLAATLRQAAEDIAPGPAILRLRVRRHIAERLTDDLDADAICDALGVSRSSLYRAMQRDGGVAAAIQRQRLARVHWLLSDPAERRSIAALATLHGFRDRSHFARLFRRIYGCPPQAVRDRARTVRPQAAPGSIQEEYVNWGSAGRTGPANEPGR